MMIDAEDLFNKLDAEELCLSPEMGQLTYTEGKEWGLRRARVLVRNAVSAAERDQKREGGSDG